MAESNLSKQIGDVERQIFEGESLMRKTNNEQVAGWVFLVIGAFMIFYFPGMWWLLGLLVAAASIWRIITTNKYKKEIEIGMKEYRGRRAELQSQLIVASSQNPQRAPTEDELRAQIEKILEED
jgi:hypothetical protein